ncbi:hypothetical protein [Methylophaga sp.]|jgi:hypothetical protein|uniref:hypothetical protein n=1 Tax=Methylophaga sp. TaxID=2024840 RepID=UPI003F72A908
MLNLLETRQLQHWNILDLQDGKSRFVGIYKKLIHLPELEYADDPDEDVYYQIVGVACISSPILEFDQNTYKGLSTTGREYMFEGPPKHPFGELRRMVIQKFSDSKFSYRYSSPAD